MTEPDVAAIARGLTKAQRAAFWAKVDVRGPDECWHWIGATHTNGYGSFWVKYRTFQAHRISLLMAETYTHGRLALHKCDNRICVNPSHLYWGSHHDNTADMWARGRQGGLPASNVDKTHCPRGHEYSGDNLRVSPTGRRNCRKCHRDRVRDYRRAKKVAVRTYLQENPDA